MLKSLRVIPLVFAAILAQACAGDSISHQNRSIMSCYAGANGTQCVSTPDGAETAATDVDGDGTDDPFVCADNDEDEDGVVDAEDTDDDGDGTADETDSDADDNDEDGVDNAEDADDDDDGVSDTDDSDDDDDGVDDAADCDDHEGEDGSDD